jgi:hypothetical protein
MIKSTSESTLQNQMFKAWHARNGAKFNEARREKYRTDGARREKARFQAAKYRQSVRETGKLPELRHGLYTVSHLAAVLRQPASKPR